MKFLKKVLFSLGIIFILFVVSVFYILWSDTFNPYDTQISSEIIPEFKKYSLDSGHEFLSESSLPMRGSTLIDIDNDGVDEIFLGGGAGQDDQLFRYTGSDFISIDSGFQTSKTLSENTLAASSVDLDNNGYSDLVLSRDTEVAVYYNTGESFTKSILNLSFNEKTTPLGLTFGDINKDGFLDMYVAGYIRKEFMNGLTNFAPGYGGRNELFLNNGDGTFQNITNSAGLDYVHNTFQGIFIDLNTDTWLDIVVAHDTGEPRIYKNNGDLTFSLKENPYTGKYSYPMGIGIGDYDNDGDSDIFFSNIGSSLPKSMVQGDLDDTDELILDWFLLENNGNFLFREVADVVKIADFEFSWGGVFSDMNNDGLQDLIVAENYVDLPFHKLFPLPGRFLIQKQDHTFVATGKRSKVLNKNFGITPLISDFNQDGRLDLVWVNISGKSFAFIQNPEIKNDFLTLQFPENSTYIGAGVVVKGKEGTQLYDTYVIGEGLAADQSNALHFGLGNDFDLQAVEISRLDGKVMTLVPNKNSIIQISDYE